MAWNETPDSEQRKRGSGYGRFTPGNSVSGQSSGQSGRQNAAQNSGFGRFPSGNSVSGQNGGQSSGQNRSQNGSQNNGFGRFPSGNPGGSCGGPGGRGNNSHTGLIAVLIGIAVILLVALLAVLLRRPAPPPAPEAYDYEYEEPAAPEPTPRPLPEPTPEPAPEPTPDESGPGPWDVRGCSSETVMPEDDEWLDDYETRYVQSTKGVSIYIRYGPGKEYEAYDIVRERRSVTVLARRGNFSFVITEDNCVGWCKSSLLVTEYIGRPQTAEKPAAPEPPPGSRPVETAYHASGSYSDGYNVIDYSYSYPFFTADSSAAKSLNREIENYCWPIISGEIDIMSQGSSIRWYWMDYAAGEYDGIASVLISCKNTANDIESYYTANYDYAADKAIGNEELLSRFGLGWSDVRAAARQKLEEVLNDDWGPDTEDAASILASELERIAGESFRNCLYIDGSGRLCLMLEAEHPYGWYWYRIVLS